MNTSRKIAAITLLTTCAFASNANAHESPIEQIVSHMVKSAIENVNHEIEVQLDTNLLSASNILFTNDPSAPSGSVKIIDLAALNAKDSSKNTDASDDKANAE